MNAVNAEIRGWILRIIHGFAPYGVSFAVLEKAVCDLNFNCSAIQLKGHLKYLKDKGYIELQEVESDSIMRRINTITPKGIDLREGNIPKDPGVMHVE